MMILSKLKSIIKTREFMVIVFITVVFLLLRLPGIHLPYHQDEMKTALSASLGGEALKMFFHPPLTQLLYRAEALIFGADNFRVFILIFAILGSLLAALIVKRRFDTNTAFLTFFFLATGAYSVHASLMLDTDGAILPLFFLASIYFYDRIHETEGNNKRLFVGLLFLSLVLGFLVKLSFIIVIGTILCDFLYREREKMTKKIIIRSLLGVIAIPVAFVVATIVIKFIHPVFSIEGMIFHARSYINFGQRGWMQIIIQAVKAIFYLSPILFILPILATREVFKKTRIFFIYLVLGLIFYFILFDFSQGALDKYLMFSIIPLSVISGAVVASVFKENKGGKKLWGIIAGIAGSAFIIFLAFLPHEVLPLYPKTAFISNVINLKWDILFPLTGGSGPLGFYMSILFIVFSFILSVIIGAVAFFKRQWQYSAVIALLIIGLTYNAVFIGEFLFGKLYGSASKVLSESIYFIKNSPEITKIITYNDSGSYELHRMSKIKYIGRFYAVPGNEEVHKKKFSEYQEHYLVVNMPKIAEDSFYGQFFAKCVSLFEAKSKNIMSNVYSCPLTKI